MSSGKRTMQNEFREASKALELNYSLDINNEDVKKDIKYLTEAFNNIYQDKSFNYYIYPNRLNLVDNYIKNTLNIIIENILNKPAIKDYSGNDLTMKFIYSIIKLLSIKELNNYPELSKAIRNIFLKIKNIYYINYVIYFIIK